MNLYSCVRAASFRLHTAAAAAPRAERANEAQGVVCYWFLHLARHPACNTPKYIPPTKEREEWMCTFGQVQGRNIARCVDAGKCLLRPDEGGKVVKPGEMYLSQNAAAPWKMRFERKRIWVGRGNLHKAHTSQSLSQRKWKTWVLIFQQETKFQPRKKIFEKLLSCRIKWLTVIF